MIYFAATLVVVVMVLYFVIQSPRIQTYLTQTVAAYLSKATGCTFQVNSVNIAFFNRIILNDISITSPQNDTLASVEKIDASINLFDFGKKQIYFSRILIQNPYSNIIIDSAGKFNFDPVLSFFSSTEPADTAPIEWKLFCNTFSVKNAKLGYHDYRQPAVSEGFDYNHIELNNLQLDIVEFEIINDVIRFGINNLAFDPIGGFKIDFLSTFITIDPIKISIKNLLVKTPQSEINASLINLRNLGKTTKTGAPRFSFTSWFNPSKINLLDFKPFVKWKENYSDAFVFSGEFRGNYQTIEGKQCKFFYGKTSLAYFDFYGRNLNTDDLHFKLNFKKVVTNKEDLENLTIADIELPSTFQDLGKIILTGDIKYYPDTLFTTLDFTSDAGIVQTRMYVAKPFTSPVFSGTFGSKDFNIGKIIGSDAVLGNMRFSTMITGRIKDQIPDLEIHGTADYIEINWVKIRKIDINGLLLGKNFDGNINVNDKNLELEFYGKVDLNPKVPVFDFTLEVFKANLINLQFVNNYAISDLSFLLVANFVGLDLDNLDGEVNLMKTKVVKNDKIIDVDDIEIKVEKDSIQKHLALHSNMAEAELHGAFLFSELSTQVKTLLFKYAPSFNSDTLFVKKDLPPFNFLLNIKNSEKITSIFYPDLHLSPNSIIEGKYDTVQSRLNIEGHFNLVSLGSSVLEDLKIKIFSKEDKISCITEVKSLNASELFTLKNFILSTSLTKDSLKANFNWNNWGKINNSANITSTLIFSNNELGQSLIKFDFLPSNIVINDTLFSIQQGYAYLNDTALIIESFKINNAEHFIELTGVSSSNPRDTMSVAINQLDLNYVNLLSDDPPLFVRGFLTGKAQFTNNNNSTLMLANFILENPTFNGEALGTTGISTSYSNSEKRLLINVNQESNEQSMFVGGYYAPESDSINLKVSLKNKNMNFLNAFVGDFLPIQQGNATGNFYVNGLLSKPELSGSVYADSAILHVDATNVDYLVSDSIRIVPDGFLFNSVTLYDPEHNKVVLKGKISHQNFSTFNMDLTFTTDKIIGMNTNPMISPLYYGKAYASGVVKISGPDTDILFDVSVTTLKNTKIYLPLSDESDLEENKFLSFVPRTQNEEKRQLNKTVEASGMEFKFDLDINPDAEVQLIFDSKVGDIIKANGNGKINLTIDQMYEIGMFGEFVIESGSYLFTLQDVINKKFEIDKGSTITWNGDSYNALINIDAVYNLKKVNLFDLTYRQEDMEARIPVSCHLLMSNTLMSPIIKFKLDFPYSSQNELQEQVNSLAEEDINKQIISLLVMNRFQPLPNSKKDPNAQDVSANSVSTNASELLSNQLSNWLSQISKDFDIGFNYRPGDQISTQEYALALGTQFLNNRIIVSTNVGVGGTQVQNNSNQNASAIAGDMIIEAKINKSGKFRAKAYTRSNKDLTYELGPYTQGVGISYREDFNTWGDLMRKYWQKLFFYTPSQSVSDTTRGR